jgi:hypothetical protein
MINYLNEIHNIIADIRGNRLEVTVMVIQLITTIPYSIAFWFNRKKKVLQWVAISCFFFALGYYLASAYLGFVIAIGTLIATIIGMVFEKRKEQIKPRIRLIAFFTMVAITIIVSLIIERNVVMWLIILIAGLPSYFSYIVFRDYGIPMHIVLILSQMAYVIYEIISSLYLFAILDFVTCFMIIGHMITVIKSEGRENFLAKKIIK